MLCHILERNVMKNVSFDDYKVTRCKKMTFFKMDNSLKRKLLIAKIVTPPPSF